MGCSICRRKQEPEVVINRAERNGYKDLFYATNEFDLSRSESENEEQVENYSLDSMKNAKLHVIKKVISPSNELTSTNNNSSAIINDIVNNENFQAGV
jgi:hypothetical protein